MKTKANIQLFSPGIVLFDPLVLSSFLQHNGVADSNVFEQFIQDENLGRAAIENGVICPMYQISEQDYSVFIENGNDAKYELPVPKFSYSDFPLKIKSGIMIASDLNALLDWDDDFFLSYKKRYDSRLSSNDFLEIESGLYNLTINGYVGLRSRSANCGYGLIFQAVDCLPAVSKDTFADDLDFELAGYQQ
ncbi:hypothetical protein OSW16_12650 [Pseudomonas putida]|uniref:hypothetical protein n=1 Tax=Pseudomonas putida TaxID=303 RepID=UPI00226DB0E3|nr:hypothetical protein [Pseudomonas putida]WAC00444.1 hypothetical protein OSW16_12650 [Pseudomonas putida]